MFSRSFFAHLSVLVVMAFAAVWTTSCVEPYEEPLPPRDRLHFPIGLEVHPNGRFLYVVNSNFDTRYREDLGGTVSVVDLQTLEILPDNSPFLPSFGGFLKLNANATKAYVTARRKESLVAFDVAENGSALFCNSGDEDRSSDPRPCTLRPESGEAQIPTDPFGLEVHTTQIGSGDEATLVDIVNLTHLRGTNLTAASFPGQSLESATVKSASLISGSNAVVRRPGTNDYYAAGRASSDLMIYTPFLGPDGSIDAIFRRGSITLSRASTAVDARSLVFDDTGETLYVVTRAPDALHIIDAGPSNTETGSGTANRVTQTISLPEEPSDIILHETFDGRRLLYIPCFEDETIQVVDPELAAIVDVIQLAAEPYEFVVDRSPNRCRPGAVCRGYVSLFNDLPESEGDCGENRRETCGSVGVIDLDPQSGRYHQLISKIH